MNNNRYRLPTDRLINRLTPHYLSGRRYILLLQSLVWPLQSLNDRFCAWARERQIEARMTSQVMWFEWWLNYRFRRYFRDASDAIHITDSTPLGVDLYREGATVGRPFTVWYEGEQVTTDREDENPRPFHLFTEEKAIAKVSFMVCVPSITIPTQEFVYMLSYAVNIYRTAGKTYLIKIDGEELKPNKTKS